MSIDKHHDHLYHSWFRLVDQMDCNGEVLISGVQDIADASRGQFNGKRVSDLFVSRGFSVSEVDLDDPRATITHDLNLPFPESMQNRFSVVLDIGTIEHVADSVSVFRNYFGSLKLGGFLFLLTPIRGYFDHGFHTFSEEFIEGILAVNGFEIIEKKYVDEQGPQISSPCDAENTLIVLSAKKRIDCHGRFTLPIQSRWERLREEFKKDSV
jgi:SAM-dependent methyltransferase